MLLELTMKVNTKRKVVHEVVTVVSYYNNSSHRCHPLTEAMMAMVIAAIISKIPRENPRRNPSIFSLLAIKDA